MGKTRYTKIYLFNSLHVHRSENGDIHVDELGTSEGLVATLFAI